MKELARRILERLVRFFLLFGICDRFLVFAAYERKRKLRGQLEQKLRRLGLYGDTVQAGPFEGMKYPGPEVWVSCRFEKLSGFYEFELHHWIERLAGSGKAFTSVVNIGAADGYFSFGLGRLFPEARIFAFEAAENRYQSLVRVGEVNGMSNRLVAGRWCSPEALASLDVGDRPLVVCDVDGFEDVLMDPALVPWLREAVILLEVHEFLAPDLSSAEKDAFEKKHPFLVRDMGRKIRERFRVSHEIEECLVGAVPIERYPVFRNLSMGEITALAESDRCCIHPWFLMTPVAARV